MPSRAQHINKHRQETNMLDNSQPRMAYEVCHRVSHRSALIFSEHKIIKYLFPQKQFDLKNHPYGAR